MNRSRIRRLSILLLGVGLVVPVSARSQNVSVHGFGDVSFRSHGAHGEPGFSLGEIDTYLTGALAERVDVLGEAVIEWHGDDWLLDLERFWVRYTVHNAFMVSAGKFHTPLGYWNRTYHHGSLLQPTVDRPALFGFGSALPIHSTGLLVSGVGIGPARVRYEVLVANGIGNVPVADVDAAKALSLRIHARPTRWLGVGASFYGDRIPAGTSRPRAAGVTVADVDQMLFLAEAQLDLGRLHLSAEGMVADNHDHAESGATRGNPTGLYALAVWDASEALRPYLLYDHQTVTASDPYYAPGDIRQIAGGSAYFLAESSVLKGEVRWDAVADEVRFALQLAVTW